VVLGTDALHDASCPTNLRWPVTWHDRIRTF
jgi:hypothetical protein